LSAVGTEPEELELRDYVRVLRRRKWIVVVVTVTVVAVALAVSLLQTPVYEGTAELLLQPRSTESLFDPNTGVRSDPNRNVQTEIQVLSSRPVRDAVEEKLGSAPEVSASPVGQTDVIEVSAESTDPEQAARIANAYAEAYIDFRRTAAVNDLLDAAVEVQAKIADLERRVEEIDERIESVPPGEREQLEASLAAERSTLVSQQSLFRQKLDQLQVDSTLKTGGAQLVTPATAPLEPIRPTPLRNGVVALTVGLILGVGLAFLREYMDDTVKSKEDVDRAAPGLTVLGFIPGIRAWKDKDRPMVVTATDSSSPAAEAYRSVRTSLQFIGIDHPLKVLQVTSPAQSEGKTTTLANLAIALASTGKRVVVLDCDLRRPRVHKFFGLDNDSGFTNVLVGDVPMSAAVQTVPGQPDLFVVTSGPTPPNPAELLSSRRTEEVFTALKATADIVLVDSPPVLPVTDASVLSRLADGVLVIAAAGLTTRDNLRRAIETLEQVDAPVVGLVLNSTRRRRGYDGYHYHYAYTYRYTSAPSSNGASEREQARSS
jgi:capsular exopolysaccharide synthesis family protein